MAGITIQGKDFSEYTIYWAEISSEKGVVTMSDQRKINFHAYRRCDACRKHFPNKQKALEWVKNFNQNLDKRYSVRLFTDKQFGMMKDGVVPFTSKQLEEVYYIG